MPEKAKAWDRFRVTPRGRTHAAEATIGVSHGPDVQADTLLAPCGAAANVASRVERTAPITCKKCVAALKQKIPRAAVAAGCPVPGTIVWVDGMPAEARHALRDETMAGGWRIEFVILASAGNEPGGFTALDHWRRYPTTPEA